MMAWMKWWLGCLSKVINHSVFLRCCLQPLLLSVVLPLNCLGAKLFPGCGCSWPSGEDSKGRHSQQHFKGPLLRKIPITFVKVFCIWCLPEVLMRNHLVVTLQILCYWLSQTGKQPCFIQWQKAEWLSLILPYPLYPVGWHFFHVFQARKWQNS